MKTVKLYETDSYENSRDCVVQELTEWEGKPALILRETIFYPLGGGQLPDTGTIDGVRVIDVQEEEEVIYHVLEKDYPFEKGQSVHCEIDWQRRFDFMQQHTGEHILSGVVENHLGYKNVGFEINEEFMRVDYNGLFTKEQLDEIEDETNRYILEARPVRSFIPGVDEIEKIDYRSKKPIETDVRIVDVEGIDVCACCGTHVDSTIEVRLIKIIDDMHHRGGTRLTVLCGERALKDYRILNDQSRKLSEALSAPSRELIEAFDKQQEIRREEGRRIVDLEREILRLRLETLGKDDEWIHFEDCLEGRDLARLSATLANDKELFLLFGGDDEMGYQYILTAKSINMREVAKAMNADLKGKGGGKPEVVRGGLQATREEIERWVQEHGDFFN